MIYLLVMLLTVDAALTWKIQRTQSQRMDVLSQRLDVVLRAIGR
jgi:hypothetical protein